MGLLQFLRGREVPSRPNIAEHARPIVGDFSDRANDVLGEYSEARERPGDATGTYRKPAEDKKSLSLEEKQVLGDQIVQLKQQKRALEETLKFINREREPLLQHQREQEIKKIEEKITELQKEL